MSSIKRAEKEIDALLTKGKNPVPCTGTTGNGRKPMRHKPRPFPTITYPAASLKASKPTRRYQSTVFYAFFVTTLVTFFLSFSSYLMTFLRGRGAGNAMLSPNF
jgi:hypothetical protein